MRLLAQGCLTTSSEAPVPAPRGRASWVRVAAARLVGSTLGRPSVVELRAVLAAYDAAGGGLASGGLAYAALVALLPGLLLALTILGLLLPNLASREAVVAAIAAAVPPLEDVGREALAQVSAGAVPTGIIAIGALLWGSSRFYTSLDTAFARLERGGPSRGPLHQLLRGFGVTVLVLLAPAAIIMTGASVDAVLAVIPGSDNFHGFVVWLLDAVSPVLALLLFPLSVGLVYRYLPARRIPLRALRLPALAAGLVMAGFTSLFGLLAPRLVGAAALYGAFVAVFALLAWLSIGFTILLLGAAWSVVRAGSAPPKP
jgi:membrane protein